MRRSRTDGCVKMSAPAILARPVTADNRRVVGLDSLRFIAAMWVVFSHFGGLPIADAIDKNHPVGFFIHGVLRNLFAGPAAVMVFFVISGFCIHYPYRLPGRFQLLSYLSRRYLRIGIPLVAAICLSRPLGVNLRLFQNSVLWSLFAELIYYSIYPLLRRLRGRFGWNKLIVVSLGLALGTLIIHPASKDYTPFGNSLNWLLGLPCWLLGCRIAEKGAWGNAAPISRRQIWLWRFGVWSLASTASVLRFHSPVGYPWTLLPFAFVVALWLPREISYFREHRAIRILEWAGQWSYSVYLIHLVANAAFDRAFPTTVGANLTWGLRIAWVLASSWLFFMLFEKPAHRMARKTGSWLGCSLAAKPPTPVLVPHP
jgi:peptidoglycan/LPS O-acetylase OafA/YrhL